jgi:hypothetical protein
MGKPTFSLDILLREAKDEEDGIEKPTHCSCSACRWRGKVSDCETEIESEGWEIPEYKIHLCPQCEEGGCIDDYWREDHE